MTPLATARRAHQALLSSLRTLENAEQNAVLRFADIMHAKHYRTLGYSSMSHYAATELKLSSSKTAQFTRLAKEVKRLPVLKEAIADGSLAWTKAREIAKIATVDNQCEWVARAKKSSRRQLEKDVRAVRKRAKARASAQPSLLAAPSLPVGDPPRTVHFELTPLQYAQFEKYMERVQRGKKRRANTDVLLEALAVLTSKNCTRVQSTAQIVAYRCDDCEKTSVPTRDGMATLSPAEAAALACDAVVATPGQRRRSTIPPKVRRAVLERDRHRCRRCGSSRFVDVHHLWPKIRKGAHREANLASLCRTCHVNWHRLEQQMLAEGVSQERVLHAAREFAKVE